MGQLEAYFTGQILAQCERFLSKKLLQNYFQIKILNLFQLAKDYLENFAFQKSLPDSLAMVLNAY